MADNFFAGAVNSDITEKLDKYEELKNKYEELCEALVGIDATDRYTHEDMLSYIHNLKTIEERYYDGQK
jgi:hypothetical protein